MEYKPAAGSKLNKDEAQKVGEFLERMESFTPSDVVSAARPESSPLHKHFTWDDLVAAEKYRLQEARNLVNHITVVVTVSGRQQETKAFHSIVVDAGDEESVPEHRYTAIRIVAKSQDMRDQVIQRALVELEGWQNRYAQYQDVFGSDIFAAITKVRKTATRRRQHSEAVPA